MKILTINQKRRGIAMTEYLIILSIIAIAAIAVVGLFGQQIKHVFSRNNAALTGTALEADTDTADTSETESIAHDMGTFQDAVEAE